MNEWISREALLESSLVHEGLLAREGMEAVVAGHCEMGLNLGRMIWTLLASTKPSCNSRANRWRSLDTSPGTR